MSAQKAQTTAMITMLFALTLLAASLACATKDSLVTASHAEVGETRLFSCFQLMQSLKISFTENIIPALADCTNDASICHENALCTEMDGSSMCVCNPGFSGDGLTCEGE